MSQARRARPPSLHLRPTERWPELDLTARVGATFEILQSRPASQLRILTWNVWFDPLYAAQRQRALLEELLAAAPDVACLQEVVPRFADAVRQCPDLCAIYDVSPQDVQPYGCMLLARRDFCADFSETKLPTRMTRRLISAVCTERCPGLVVTTCHLESLDNPKLRREQLQVAVKMLQGRQHSVLCGDFNFDDTKTFGDWKRSKSALPVRELENNVLQKILPGFCDTWRQLRPGDPGYTFDGKLNPTCCRDPQERMRYDRILVARDCLTPAAASILGTEVLQGCEEWGLRPSDHFGLLADLEIKTTVPSASPLCPETASLAPAEANSALTEASQEDLPQDGVVGNGEQ